MLRVSDLDFSVRLLLGLHALGCTTVVGFDNTVFDDTQNKLANQLTTHHFCHIEPQQGKCIECGNLIEYDSSQLEAIVDGWAGLVWKLNATIRRARKVIPRMTTNCMSIRISLLLTCAAEDSLDRITRHD